VKCRVPEVDFSRSPDRPKNQWEHTIWWKEIEWFSNY
jgi:hypothetical protein